ncbi:MAG: XRE family transcriptional regulator [Actinomycetota bacterium]
MTVDRGLIRERNKIGYSQEEVSHALGVSRAMISYWESGTRRPNDRQLVALANLFGVEPGELLSDAAGDPEGADLAQMMFRGETMELSAPARHGIERFVRFLDDYAELSELAKIPIRGAMQSPFGLTAGYDSTEDARRKAEEVRAHLRLGLGPVGDVDMACELLGITVFRADLGDDLDSAPSGAFLKHPRVGLSILVNLQMTPGRRRFTVAHEVGHALFHSDRHSFVVSRRTGDGVEKFANAFAGEFLMPVEGLRRAMEEQGFGPRIEDAADVVHLQRFFRVSYASTLVRLRQARFLTSARYDEFRQIRPVLFAAALGYETVDEEYEQDVEHWRIRRFPPKFVRMIRVAVEGGVISSGTAAAITGLSIDEIEELVAQDGPADPETRAEIEEFAGILDG